MRHPRSRGRTLAIAISAAVLVWLIVSRSFAAYLAGAAPEIALWLDPWQPQALVGLADRTLNSQLAAATGAESNAGIVATEQSHAADEAASANAEKPSTAFSAFESLEQRRTVDLAQVREWATDAVISEPLNAQALQILGQVADASKDAKGAAIFMQAAAELSHHQPVAIYWLMMKSFDEKNYEATLQYADILLRARPDVGSYTVPTLARLAADKNSGPLLQQVLTDDPPWRDFFIQELPRSVTDERIPLELLLAMRTSSHPPTLDDVNHYLSFLVSHKLYTLAYYTWLQFLPPEQLRSAGFIYNGDFAIVPTGSPFDWIITQGAGVTVDIEPRPDKHGAYALVTNFKFGRVDFHSVKQLIMLTPGHYQFTGELKGSLIGPRGLRWRVACADDPAAPFAESEMLLGRYANWSNTQLDFTVPEKNCRAQYLSLDLDARMPSEHFVSGSMWFDNLRISRLAGAAAPSADVTKR